MSFCWTSLSWVLWSIILKLNCFEYDEYFWANMFEVISKIKSDILDSTVCRSIKLFDKVNQVKAITFSLWSYLPSLKLQILSWNSRQAHLCQVRLNLDEVKWDLSEGRRHLGVCLEGSYAYREFFRFVYSLVKWLACVASLPLGVSFLAG